jgi:hypothetical protein
MTHFHASTNETGSSSPPASFELLFEAKIATHSIHTDRGCCHLISQPAPNKQTRMPRSSRGMLKEALIMQQSTAGSMEMATHGGNKYSVVSGKGISWTATMQHYCGAEYVTASALSCSCLLLLMCVSCSCLLLLVFATAACIMSCVFLRRANALPPEGGTLSILLGGGGGGGICKMRVRRLCVGLYIYRYLACYCATGTALLRYCATALQQQPFS